MKIGKKKILLLDQSEFVKFKRPPKCFVLSNVDFILTQQHHV